MARKIRMEQDPPQDTQPEVIRSDFIDGGMDDTERAIKIEDANIEYVKKTIALIVLHIVSLILVLLLVNIVYDASVYSLILLGIQIILIAVGIFIKSIHIDTRLGIMVLWTFFIVILWIMGIATHQGIFA